MTNEMKIQQGANILQAGNMIDQTVVIMSGKTLL